MRPVGGTKKRKRKESFIHQTSYLLRPPTSTEPRNCVVVSKS